MIRLLDRHKIGPNGFLYHEKRTDWKSWEIDPSSQWDFGLLCRKYQEHARANPGLGLPTDLPAIEQMIDFSNAMRYLSIPGADIYVYHGPGPPKTEPPPQWPRLQRAAGALANLNTGRKTLAEWWGEGGVPVAKELAVRRAEVCAAPCPMNAKGGLLARFTRELAARLQANIEEMNDLNMTTDYDEAINVCEACDCPLRLKIWTPLKHIHNNMPPEQKNKLWDKCWILHETP